MFTSINRYAQSSYIETDSNRNTRNKIDVENANLCGKICDMRTLLKYAKNAAIAYSRNTGMPIHGTDVNWTAELRFSAIMEQFANSSAPQRHVAEHFQTETRNASLPATTNERHPAPLQCTSIS